MLLAKHTKPHVTVALSGDGADELLAGYQGYLNPNMPSYGKNKQLLRFLQLLSSLRVLRKAAKTKKL